MKYSIIFLFAFTIISCSSEQGTESVRSGSLEGFPENAEVIDYADTPGISKATIKVADNIQQQGDYFDGKLNGSWTEYHGNGVVKSITTYVHGLKQGIEVQIDDRGSMLSKAYFHNGEYDGEVLKFKRGKIVERKSYQNGILSGLLTKYYDNGKLMEESPYENGKIHGVAKWYDKEQNVTLQYEYKDGEFIGEVE